MSAHSHSIPLARLTGRRLTFGIQCQIVASYATFKFANVPRPRKASARSPLRPTRGRSARADGRAANAAVRATHWQRYRNDIALLIEAAALKLFLARGAEEVTAEEIAEAAGISRRTFFRHFESKDDIIACLPMRSLRRTAEAVRARPPEESIVQALLAVAREQPPPPDERELQRLWFRVISSQPDAWMRSFARVHVVTDQVFAEIVADRLRLAGGSDAHASALGAALNAVVRQVYVEWAREGGTGDWSTRLETALRALVCLDNTSSGPTDPAYRRKKR
jgi:AcrR family transcriptional regulator